MLTTVERGVTSLLVLLLHIHLACAQQTAFKNYSVNNGLPSNEVYQTFQDSKGYIWIASDKGVSRFNGREFTNYSSSNGLPDNTVFEFYEDHHHRIWFHSYLGKISYFFEDSIYADFPSVEGGIESIFVDENDTIWIGSTVAEYQMFQDEKNKYQLVPTIEQYAIRTFNDTDWIYSGARFYLNESEEYTCLRFLIKGEEIVHHNGQRLYNVPDSALRIHVGSTLTNMERVSDTSFYYFTSPGIFKITPSKSTLLIPHKKRLKGGTLGVFDSEKDLWIFGKEFHSKYNGAKLENPSRYYFLNDQKLTYVMVDNEGGHWFSTHENGVFYAPFLELLSYPASKIFNLPVAQIANNDKNIFVSTYTRDIFELKGNKFTMPDNPIYQNLGVYGLEAHEGALYIPNQRGVYKQIGNAGHWVGHREEEFARWAGDEIAFGEENALFVTSATHVSYFRNDSLVYDDQIHTKDNIRVRSSWVLNKEELLIGTNRGLKRYNYEKKFFDVKCQHPLLNARVDDIEQDAQGLFWIATRSEGVYTYDGDTIVHHFTSEDGLAGDICNRIHIAEDAVWVATQNGLSRIDLNTPFEIRNIDINDGLISNQINDIHTFRDTVWVATDQGVSVIPLNFEKKPYRPKVYLKSFFVNDRVKPKATHFELSHLENIIRIEYEGVAFRAGNNLRYKYRLLGLDSVWSTSNSSSIQYTTLPPGDYQFQVMALNSDRIPSDVSSLQFVIQRPFWSTVWFIVLCIGMALVLLYLVVRIRLSQLRRKEGVRRRLVETELKALRAQINPHFTFNAMNSIQNFIRKSDSETALHYIAKFARLMRMILDHTSEELITIVRELEALAVYMELEALRFEGKFRYVIEVEEGVDVEYHKIPPMTLQPLVENAIWHGVMHKASGGGLVQVKVTQTDTHIICSVTDNGIGRAQSRLMKGKHLSKHQSFGIRMIEDRFMLVNQEFNQQVSMHVTDLKDHENKPLGTQVEIHLLIA